MFKNCVAICTLLAIYAVTVESANILAVFTSNSPSHQIIHMTHVRALVERGHNVTVITTHPLKDKNPKYHHIIIPQTEERTKQVSTTMRSMGSGEIKTIWQYFQFAKTSIQTIGPIQYDATKSERFQELMNNPGNKFDLVLLGYFFNDYHLGLGEHFNCPIVVSLTAGTQTFVNRFVGNPAEISYVPSILTLKKRDPTSFLGRLEYFFNELVSRYYIYIMDKQFSEFYNDLFPSSKYPPIGEAAKRVSLILSNSHFSEGVIRPNVPAIVDVGGIQIKEKPDPLPKDLQDIIDSAKDGVIYLSFGSNLGSKQIGEQSIKNLYNVLSSLKQTVLWKWDNSPTPGNAPNIHFQNWLPQDDLLSQKNVKLFITHAGKGSVAESQFHGVPMVAVPMFADQPASAKKLVDDGFGVELDKTNLTEDLIRSAVLEVLGNPKYTENVQRFSKIYRDRPMSARETSVYWIEYVLRHKGAYHMQSPAVHLNGFQILSLDVVGFLLLIAFVVFKTVTIVGRFFMEKLISLIRKSPAKKKTKTKKN